MTIWSKRILALMIAIFFLAGAQFATAAEGGGGDAEEIEPVNLGELADGAKVYPSLKDLLIDSLQLYEEDAEAIVPESFYEVDLGNNPQGYERQFMAFVYNYEWIELVLIASNKDASDVRLLDRAASSDEGYMFLNMAKLEFTTTGNLVQIWTEAPYSAFRSLVELEWAGDRFYVISHEYDDPSERYFEEKERLLKLKDIQKLVEQYETEIAYYPSAYEQNYTLAAPALKLAQQKANQIQKVDFKKAVEYLDYGLSQYADAFGTWGYVDGTLTKADIVGAEDSLYLEARLGLGVYVGMLNDYGYYLSLAGRNKEAVPVLANVIKLVPGRTVAYLNIADAEWTLGQKNAAKAHYKTYLKLLGGKAKSTAPARVQQRINAK
ncbi:hypothetical protein ACFPPD_04995 [Cohnella suwonensis]|uniref:Tetratricopeptide repeat protein n=1 Tax=Cohnella suwonensis TaxID=696072 RepID=A0ABW0LTH5_9BACL